MKSPTRTLLAALGIVVYTTMVGCSTTSQDAVRTKVQPLPVEAPSNWPMGVSDSSPQNVITQTTFVRRDTACHLLQPLLDVTYEKQRFILYYQGNELDLAAEAYRIRYAAEFMAALAVCMVEHLNNVVGDTERALDLPRQREEIQARRLVIAALKDANETYRKSLISGYFFDRLEAKIRNADRIEVSGCNVKGRAFAAENIRTSWRNSFTIDNNLTKAADEYVKCLEHANS